VDRCVRKEAENRGRDRDRERETEREREKGRQTWRQREMREQRGDMLEDKGTAGRGRVRREGKQGGAGQRRKRDREGTVLCLGQPGQTPDQTVSWRSSLAFLGASPLEPLTRISSSLAWAGPTPTSPSTLNPTRVRSQQERGLRREERRGGGEEAAASLASIP
jgi:hypothetical protein